MTSESDTGNNAFYHLLAFLVGVGMSIMTIWLTTIIGRYTDSGVHLIWYFGALSVTCIFGYVNPRRVWRWGVAVSLGYIAGILSLGVVDLPQSLRVTVSGKDVFIFSFGGMIGSFAGAFVGLLIRKSADSIRKEGWKCLWP